MKLIYLISQVQFVTTAPTFSPNRSLAPTTRPSRDRPDQSMFVRSRHCCRYWRCSHCKPFSRIWWPFCFFRSLFGGINLKELALGLKSPNVSYTEYVHLVLIQFFPFMYDPSTETKGWSLSAPSLRSRKYRQRYHSLRVIVNWSGRLYFFFKYLVLGVNIHFDESFVFMSTKASYNLPVTSLKGQPVIKGLSIYFIIRLFLFPQISEQDGRGGHQLAAGQQKVSVLIARPMRETEMFHTPQDTSHID